MFAPTGFGPGIDSAAEAIKNATVNAEKKRVEQERVEQESSVNVTISNPNFIGKENDPKARGAESNMDFIMNT